MPQAASYAFAYHQLLVVIAARFACSAPGSACAISPAPAPPRARPGYGWLFMASVGTGAALWASTFISILALDPSLNSGFEPVATGVVLVVAIIACLVGFEIGSRHFTLAPEAGGLVMGVGILAMHFIALKGWHIAGTVEWNAYGVAMTFVLGLGFRRSRSTAPIAR